ncbi:MULTISPECIES: hypothetical protein [Amycolatopsis]|uniref:hypothetical protein n=1 Tax=Amycolatopsis TaxID=1813 RepID=UPI0011612120|nr:MULTISPECIES: hypothetical protein [Amycolatopsis]
MRFENLHFPELTVWRDEDEVIETEKYRMYNLRIELRSPKHTGVITAGRMTYIDGTYTDGTIKWWVTSPRGEEIGGGARPTCE